MSLLPPSQRQIVQTWIAHDAVKLPSIYADSLMTSHAFSQLLQGGKSVCARAHGALLGQGWPVQRV